MDHGPNLEITALWGRTHCDWKWQTREKLDLPFPLLCDPNEDKGTDKSEVTARKAI